ncbi:MAG TPA: helix-turn-helix domain-containing protein [Acidimicrobiales bacterium]|nr:helix-turn-helix domain-containing protein [Acidimicrobiales bacterium]
MSDEELQDWVRIPSDRLEVNARVQALQLRAARLRKPSLDESGRFAVGSRWIPLSPIEARLVGVLIERFGTMVTRDELAVRAWPGGQPTRNQLDVRLRVPRSRIRAAMAY